MPDFVNLFDNQYSIVNNQLQSYPVRRSDFNRNKLPYPRQQIKPFSAKKQKFPV